MNQKPHTVERGDVFVPEPHQRVTQVTHTAAGSVQVFTVDVQQDQLIQNNGPTLDGFDRTLGHMDDDSRLIDGTWHDDVVGDDAFDEPTV